MPENDKATNEKSCNNENANDNKDNVCCIHTGCGVNKGLFCEEGITGAQRMLPEVKMV